MLFGFWFFNLVYFIWIDYCALHARRKQEKKNLSSAFSESSRV
jgi:hypothetical protein